MSINDDSVVKKVLIIGGGISGIAAASRLYEYGIHDIIILEAEDRLGGRVYTIDLENDQGFVELGAQWIHGEEQNAVFEMISSHNLHQHSPINFFDMEFARSSSELIPRKISNKLFEKFNQIRHDIDLNKLNEFKTSGDYFKHKLNEMYDEDDAFESSPGFRDEFTEWCHQFINTVDACDNWFESASSTLVEYWDCPGNSLVSWNKGGYRTLIELLTEKAREKSPNENFLDEYFIKNKRVNTIRSDNENVIHVECDDGSRYLARHIIVTVSLGVLKQNCRTLFGDGLVLPKEKITAIQSLGFGTVDKIYMKFSKRWWTGDINGFSFLWSSKDREEYVSRGLAWVIDVYSICRVDNAPNILCGWLSGPSARKMERIDGKIICATMTEIMRKFLGTRYDITPPDYCLRSNWFTNANFCGSYSFRTPQSDDLGVFSTILSTPLTDTNAIPRVLFAGEATHQHYYSTVHGAIETGWREADRLIPYLQSNKKE